MKKERRLSGKVGNTKDIIEVEKEEVSNIIQKGAGRVKGIK